MLADYIAAGFDPDRFWRITLREYQVHMTGAGKRLEREHKERAWLAHTTAALSGVSGKDFPTLDDLTNPKPKVSQEEKMLLVAKKWDAVVSA